jgi:hypothetical protein
MYALDVTKNRSGQSQIQHVLADSNPDQVCSKLEN